MKVRNVLAGLGGRKFLLSVFAVVAVVVNSKFKLDVPHSVLEKIADLVMLYIAGESAVDIAGTIKSGGKKR